MFYICKISLPNKYYKYSIEEIEIGIKELGYVGTGKKYGVSDNAIRKWETAEMVDNLALEARAK